MSRLNSIFASNNYISKVGNLGEHLQSITVLVLTNNKIQDLTEINNIATLKKLEHLSLLDNPVMLKQNYRNYVIYKMPTLKSLDFQKILQTERENVTKYFKTAAGKGLLNTLSPDNISSSYDEESKNEALEPNQESSTAPAATPQLTLTEEQKKLVRDAIQKAKSKDEIDLIEKHLKVISYNVDSMISLELNLTSIIFIFIQYRVEHFFRGFVK